MWMFCLEVMRQPSLPIGAQQQHHDDGPAENRGGSYMQFVQYILMVLTVLRSWLWLWLWSSLVCANALCSPPEPFSRVFITLRAPSARRLSQ